MPVRFYPALLCAPISHVTGLLYGWPNSPTAAPVNLKKQHHFLWLLEDSCFPCTLPSQEDAYSCVLGIPHSLRNFSTLWCPHLLSGRVPGVRHPGFFFLATLVERSTVVNWFIKHFPSVPLVCLQRSTYLVLCYAAVRDLNTVHAMFKSRV